MAEGLTNNQKLAAGVVVAAVGLVVILWFLNDDSDSDAGSGGDVGTATLGCTLTVAGIGAIASALKVGGTVNEVVRIVAPTISTAACTAAVKKLAAGQSATVKVDSTEGSTVPQVLDPFQLTQPAPAAPASPELTPLYCYGWANAMMFEMCKDGVIGRPS